CHFSRPLRVNLVSTLFPYTTLFRSVGVMIIDSGVKLAASYAWEELRRGDIADTLVRRLPVGVVAAIVPWNMPQLGALTKMVPSLDRKSTRLNSSHQIISYAVFCLKK